MARTQLTYVVFDCLYARGGLCAAAQDTGPRTSATAAA